MVAGIVRATRRPREGDELGEGRWRRLALEPVTHGLDTGQLPAQPQTVEYPPRDSQIELARAERCPDQERTTDS